MSLELLDGLDDTVDSDDDCRHVAAKNFETDEAEPELCKSDVDSVSDFGGFDGDCDDRDREIESEIVKDWFEEEIVEQLVSNADDIELLEDFPLPYTEEPLLAGDGGTKWTPHRGCRKGTFFDCDHALKGPRLNADEFVVQTPTEAVLKFLTKEMLERIMKNTNEKLAETLSSKLKVIDENSILIRDGGASASRKLKRNLAPCTVEDIKTMLGAIILRAVRHRHSPWHELYATEYGQVAFKAAMPRDRLIALTRNFRIDDKTERKTGLHRDPTQPLQKFVDEWNE